MLREQLSPPWFFHLLVNGNRVCHFLQVPKLHDCRKEENVSSSSNRFAKMRDFFYPFVSINHGIERLVISQDATPDSY